MVWLGANGDNIDEIKEMWARSVTDSNLYPFDFRLKPIWELIGAVDNEKGKEVERILKLKWNNQMPQTPVRYAQGARNAGIKNVQTGRWLLNPHHHAIAVVAGGTGPASNPKMRWVIESFSGHVGIKSVESGRWLCSSVRMINDKRRQVRIESQEADTCDFRWVIEYHLGYVGIKSVKYGEYMYVTLATKYGERQIATWRGEHVPANTESLRWKIEPF